LVRPISGRIFDVVVDLRPRSATFGQWQGFYLDASRPQSLYIPEGFGHGYLVLEESVVSYQCAERFYAEYDDGIRWDDPDIGIDWPLHLVDEAILSQKDQGLQSFAAFRANAD
jgi:dTDP-4-dehydrorhamnose 3,5-epimerase